MTRSKQSKGEKSIPHVTAEGSDPSTLGLAGIHDSPSVEDETAASLAIEQAESVEIIPPPTAPAEPLWLPGVNGSATFNVATVSKRLRDAEGDIGRMKGTVQNGQSRLTGSSGKGGVLWEGVTLRPAQNEREKAAFALARAARAFSKALRDYGATMDK